MSPIKKDKTVRDLGIFIDDELNFKTHIKWAANRFAKDVGNPSLILKIYDIYIRSIEYGIVIWNLEKTIDLKNSITLHKKITSIALRNRPYWHPNHIHYHDCLQQLNTLTPEQRYLLLITKVTIKITKNETITSLFQYLKSHILTNNPTRNPNIYYNFTSLHHGTTLFRGMTTVNRFKNDISLSSSTNVITKIIKRNIMATLTTN